MIFPFDLNLRHLRALPLIVERGSMSAAADAIGLSQPALAQGLGKLEAQFGTSLFVRRSDGMDATAPGGAAIERVREALARLALAMRPSTKPVRRAFDRAENLLTATQVRAFLNLAEAGSFVGAARATGASQPALHRAVRELEALAGFALVERRGRGMALTEQGQRVARQFRLASADLAAALEEAQGFGQGGRIAVGAMPLCRALLLPRAIARLARASPSAHIEVAEGSYSDLVEPLRDGRIDLMIGALRDPPPPDLAQLPLFEDQLAIIARRDHPLARRAPATTAALGDFPWIIGRPATPLRAQWERLFAATGLALPRAPIECGSVMTIRGVLLESDFLTLLSPDQVALELRTGLLVTIGPPLPASLRTIGVISRADWRPTLLQREFLELLRNVVSRRSIQEIR